MSRLVRPFRSFPDASKRIKEPLCFQQESAEAVPIIARRAVVARRYFIFCTPLFGSGVQPGGGRRSGPPLLTALGSNHPHCHVRTNLAGAASCRPRTLFVAL